MPHVHITVDEDAVMAVEVLTIEADNRRFINITMGRVTVSLPGFDAWCEQAARDLASKLIEAADSMNVAEVVP